MQYSPIPAVRCVVCSVAQFFLYPAVFRSWLCSCVRQCHSVSCILPGIRSGWKAIRPIQVPHQGLNSSSSPLQKDKKMLKRTLLSWKNFAKYKSKLQILVSCLAGNYAKLTTTWQKDRKTKRQKDKKTKRQRQELDGQINSCSTSAIKFFLLCSTCFMLCF